MKSSAGFTLPEVAMSAAILAIGLFAGAIASKVALDATEQVVVLENAEANLARARDRISGLLVSASIDSLEAIPAAGGQVAEPMQDDLAYDNLRFRAVVDYAAGAPVFVPPLDEEPYRLWLDAPTQTLQLDTGAAAITIATNVTQASIRRSGTRLTLAFTAAPEHEGRAIPADCTLSVRLLVP